MCRKEIPILTEDFDLDNIFPDDGFFLDEFELNCSGNIPTVSLGFFFI